MSKTNQVELLKLFANTDANVLEHADGNIYVKSYNPVLGRWIVAKYTKLSYARREAYLTNRKLDSEMIAAVGRD